MMDLSKSFEFFNPADLKNSRIHIIGCGAIGSTVAEQLVRYGIENITLYDFDRVEEHNIANQMFRRIDVGKLKTEALAEMLCDINPDLQKTLRLEGKYETQRLSGYVVLCVDSIDLRRKIATSNKNNRYIKGMFDYRMRLTDAQHFAADWSDPAQVDAFIETMQFSDADAAEATPVSACNIELSVVSTPRAIVSLGVANLLNLIKGLQPKSVILLDAFQCKMMAM